MMLLAVALFATISAPVTADVWYFMRFHAYRIS